MGKMVGLAAAELVGKNFLESLETQPVSEAEEVKTKPAQKKLKLIHQAVSLTPFANRIKTKTGLKALTLKKNEEPCFYIFNGEDKGFVIVSADDAAEPILGYSSTNSFDAANMPPHMTEYLEKLRKAILYLKQNKKTAGKKITAQWNNLNKKDTNYILPGEHLPVFEKKVPLIKTKWNQSGSNQNDSYNKFCPPDCPTGCVATAMAQIMNYYSYPNKGEDSRSLYMPYDYTDRPLPKSVTYIPKNAFIFPLLKADFNTAYRWDLMPFNLTDSPKIGIVDAVAELMIHIGIAVNMNYAPDGSGANINPVIGADAQDAFQDYFKYTHYIESEGAFGIFSLDDDDDKWVKILKDDISKGWPILYAGHGTGGHAFIIDGCDVYLFHINWGWGGEHDGYFSLKGLNTPDIDNDGIDEDFNGKNRFLHSIRPKGSVSDIVKIAVKTSFDSVLKQKIDDNTYEPFLFPWGEMLIAKGYNKTFTISENDYIVENIYISGKGNAEKIPYGDPGDKKYQFTIYDIRSNTDVELTLRTKREFRYNGIAYKPLEEGGYKHVEVIKNSYLGDMQIPGVVNYHVPYSVCAVGEEAFKDCNDLTSVQIGEWSDIDIKKAAFAGCYKLANINFGERIRTVYAKGLSGCMNLAASIKFDKLKEIGDEAFHNCIEFESDVIIKSTADVGVKSFYNCKKLKSLTIQPDTDIKENIKISDEAFSYCIGLASIEIYPHSGIKEIIIGQRAFYNCAGVKQIISLADTPPSCAANSFDGIDIDIPIYVPFNKISDYKKASGWKRFVNFKAIEFDYSSNGTTRFRILDCASAEVVCVIGCGKDYKHRYVVCGHYVYFGEYNVIDIPVSVNYRGLPFEVKSFADNAFEVNNLSSVSNMQVTTIRFGRHCQDADSNVDKVGKFAFANRQNVTHILLWSHNPPTLPSGYENTVFNNIDTSKIVLSVPKGSESKYKNALIWKDFDIRGTDNESTGSGYSSFDIIDIVNPVWLKMHPEIPRINIEKIQNILSSPVIKKVILQMKSLNKADNFAVKVQDLIRVIKTKEVADNLTEIQNLFLTAVNKPVLKGKPGVKQQRQLKNELSAKGEAVYYVSKRAQKTGEHEVHAGFCKKKPSVSAMIKLGKFFLPREAVKEAGKRYKKVDGCYYCCREEHKM